MKRNGFFLLLLLCLSAALSAREAGSPIHIWAGTGVQAPAVTLTPYLPEGREGTATAIIVCPGGSYFWLDVEREGRMVAEWLQEQGIAAFLLQYRTGGWFNFTFRTHWFFSGHHFPEMVQDIQRAIQLVREDADAYGINPDRLGVMGFSAGGHLVMLSAELCDEDFLAPLGVDRRVSLRPDFVAPIYPVVTLEDRPFVHSRSRRGLLGVSHKKDKALRERLSLERQVSAAAPPVFLLNCVDDPVVDYRNANLLDSALTANKTPHLFVQYKTGGHGFGADPQKFSEETKHWQECFIQWLKTLFVDED
ncbi:MAG: alpha/beta hydrolase [Bacteroidales bacterium]|nr:alpha/beta hydrolase [Bacteroidales bacterium]